MGYKCGVHFHIDTLGTHTFSLSWGTLTLGHTLYRQGIYTKAHMMDAYANLYVWTHMHAYKAQLHTQIHSHIPIHPYGAYSDPEHMLPLRLASYSSFPSGHIRTLAPCGGPLLVCAGSPFFIPEIRLQRAVISGIKWILKMACVTAVSSRQTEFTTEPSDVVLIGRWRRMEKINWHLVQKV